MLCGAFLVELTEVSLTVFRETWPSFETALFLVTYNLSGFAYYGHRKSWTLCQRQGLNLYLIIGGIKNQLLGKLTSCKLNRLTKIQTSTCWLMTIWLMYVSKTSASDNCKMMFKKTWPHFCIQVKHSYYITTETGKNCWHAVAATVWLRMK